MALYAIFDLEFWLLMLRGLWLFVLVIFLLGFGAGFLAARFKPFELFNRALGALRSSRFFGRFK